MNLIIISQYFYPEQFCVSDVSFKLASMGHNVTVLTGLPNYPAGNIFNGYNWSELPKENFNQKLDAYVEKINGVNVIRCNLYPRKKGKLNLFCNYFSFLFKSSKVILKMHKNKLTDFDNIICFQFSPVTMVIPGMILKKKIKKPLILYCFDLWPESIVSAGLPNQGLLYNCILSLSKWIYTKADILLISSKSFKEYFRDKLKIKASITYLPIYAETLFEKSNSSNKCSLSSSGITNLVFAGNTGEMQSLETIVYAANLLKNRTDIHFHIVGDGSALDKNITLSKTLELNNITFHGRHPLEEMPKYYELADAFLVTLKKDPFISYTLPGKVQSYMAYGKPIIAAIDGETHEVIKRAGCGLCCHAEDFQSLANNILIFSEEKNNRYTFSDCSKHYYRENFSEESFFKAFLAFLKT